jgi:hypothetical protein
MPRGHQLRAKLGYFRCGVIDCLSSIAELHRFCLACRAFFRSRVFSARRVAANSDRELLFFFGFLELVLRLVLVSKCPRKRRPVAPCSAVTLGTTTGIMARWLGVAWELNSITEICGLSSSCLISGVIIASVFLYIQWSPLRA